MILPPLLLEAEVPLINSTHYLSKCNTFALQSVQTPNVVRNSLCETPRAHGSDLAPVKYPTGVTDSSRKYFSRHALHS
jgi:hypothetical protein